MEELEIVREKAMQAMAILKAADAGLEEIEQILALLRELANESAAAGAGADRRRFQRTADALIKEIDAICEEVEACGVKPLKGGFEVRV